MTRLGERGERPLAAWPTAEELAAIRSDPELSEQGRTAAIEARYAQASPKLPEPYDLPDPRIHFQD